MVFQFAFAHEGKGFMDVMYDPPLMFPLPACSNTRIIASLGKPTSGENKKSLQGSKSGKSPADPPLVRHAWEAHALFNLQPPLWQTGCRGCLRCLFFRDRISHRSHHRFCLHLFRLTSPTKAGRGRLCSEPSLSFLALSRFL